MKALHKSNSVAAVAALLSVAAGCSPAPEVTPEVRAVPTRSLRDVDQSTVVSDAAREELQENRSAAPCDKVAQLSAGASFTCVRFQAGRVTCWGENENGELGQGDRQGRGQEPGSLSKIPSIDFGGQRIASIVSAGAHSCVLTEGGKVACWGANDFGVLGLGHTSRRGDDANEMGSDLSYVDLGNGRRATSLASGTAHVCAIVDDESVKCWGWNDDGQLGQGDRKNRGSGPGEMGDALKPVLLGSHRTAKNIAAGARHTCAILDDDTLKCWGGNQSGELGLGDTKNRGDEQHEMGDSLPRVDLGRDRTVLSVAAGDQHTCALLDNAAVKCWGSGLAGALGRGDTKNVGDDPQEMGDRLQPVDLGTESRPTSLVAAGFRSCAVFADGGIKCWGGNSFGALGLGDAEDRGSRKSQMGNALPKVDLGSGSRVVSLALSPLHACALLDDNSVKCWGYGKGGALGYGDSQDRGHMPADMGDRLERLDLTTPCR